MNQPHRTAVRSTEPRTAVNRTAPGWRRRGPRPRKQVDGAHLAVDSQADCGRERAERLVTVDLLAGLHIRERIPDADADADQLGELRSEPGKVRGAAGQDDLADAQRAGLRLVELERGDELAGEGVSCWTTASRTFSACSLVAQRESTARRATARA